MRNHEIWTVFFGAAIAANNSVKQAEAKADDAFSLWQKKSVDPKEPAPISSEAVDGYEAEIDTLKAELIAAKQAHSDTAVELENARKREKAWADAHEQNK